MATLDRDIAMRVSVIVRSMARSTLPTALASIAAQAIDELEVVVVAACGAHHPGLPERCGPHRLRLVESPVALRRPHAANAGLDAAAGDWIAFLDDDDAFLPGHLEALLAAAASTPGSQLIYSFANAVLADGAQRRIGRPFNLLQLHERNFIHLSTALIRRDLIAAGCRFDEELDILEDWDFMIQLAQHTHPHFVPVTGFEWRADLGDSGAGGGANQDDARFARFRDRIYAKWSVPRDLLIERVSALLHTASDLARAGDLAGARARCQEALQASPNDPWALNLVAMLQRAAGQLADARRTQEFAVAVRPEDPSLVFNLAQVASAQQDFDMARRCCERALALEPGYAPAIELQASLPASTLGLRSASLP